MTSLRAWGALYSKSHYLFSSGWGLTVIYFHSLQDSKTPISIAYHIFDIYLTELERSLSGLSEEEDATLSSSPVPLIRLLKPLIEVSAGVTNKDHFKRITQNIFEPLMDMLDEQSDEPSFKRRRLGVDEDEENKGQEVLLRNQPETLKIDILRSIFDIGAHEGTDPVNRKRLYKFAADHGLDD